MFSHIGIPPNFQSNASTAEELYQSLSAQVEARDNLSAAQKRELLSSLKVVIERSFPARATEIHVTGLRQSDGVSRQSQTSLTKASNTIPITVGMATTRLALVSMINSAVGSALLGAMGDHHYRGMTLTLTGQGLLGGVIVGCAAGMVLSRYDLLPENYGVSIRQSPKSALMQKSVVLALLGISHCVGHAMRSCVAEEALTDSPVHGVTAAMTALMMLTFLAELLGYISNPVQYGETRYN